MTDYHEELFRNIDGKTYQSIISRQTLDYYASVKQVSNSVLSFIPVLPIADIVAQYSVYEWSCLHCAFQTMNVAKMLTHCCCQWQQTLNCRGHRIRTHYCAAECLDCGWGVCGCFTMHCCCPDTPPDCQGGLIHFLNVLPLMTILDELVTSERNGRILSTLFDLTRVNYVEQDLQWLRKIKRFRTIIDFISTS